MRIWKVRFQVLQAFESLPFPGEVVFEEQSSCDYHIEESRRGKTQSGQIVCTIEGEGAFRHGNEITKLHAGSTFISCHCNQDVSYYYPGHAHGVWRFLWVSFYGSQAVNLISEFNERYGYVFEIPLEGGLAGVLESYKSQRGTIQIVTPTAGAKIVHDMLSLLGETVEVKLSGSSHAKLTRAARELIALNMGRELDVCLMAEKLHVTREHLTRVFRAQTGMSPGMFASNERMKVAARLLLDGTLSVKETAERLGYLSQSSFARAFKSFYGVGPSVYREHPDVVAERYLRSQASNKVFIKPVANELPVIGVKGPSIAEIGDPDRYK